MDKERAREREREIRMGLCSSTRARETQYGESKRRLGMG